MRTERQIYQLIRENNNKVTYTVGTCTVGKEIYEESKQIEGGDEKEEEEEE